MVSEVKTVRPQFGPGILTTQDAQVEFDHEMYVMYRMIRMYTHVCFLVLVLSTVCAQMASTLVVPYRTQASYSREFSDSIECSNVRQ